jgi:hypothetical protein
MAWHVAFLFVVQLNFAEELCSGLELVRCKVLVAHHQHVILDEGPSQEGAVIGVDWLREVESSNLDAGVSRQGRDGQRHRMTLHARGCRQDARAGRGKGQAVGKLPN